MTVASPTPRPTWPDSSTDLSLTDAECAEVLRLARELVEAEPHLMGTRVWMDEARRLSSRLPLRLRESLRRYRHDPGPDGLLIVRNPAERRGATARDPDGAGVGGAPGHRTGFDHRAAQPLPRRGDGNTLPWQQHGAGIRSRVLNSPSPWNRRPIKDLGTRTETLAHHGLRITLNTRFGGTAA
ncbi:hypothetical protein [Streptomyces sp. NPDC058457]|uniref:hypothetical protein n=1 Tax=Streptomyces sp. NPDC058457 TaxID=3346507 RepID=UPI003664D593